MNLQNIKLSLIRDNNQEGLLIIKKIQNYVKQYNVSINKVITYMLSNYQSQYQKRILTICRSVYPYDGQVNPKMFMKNISNIYEQQIDTIYKIGSHKTSNNRLQHYQDNDIIQKKIGTKEELVLLNNINKSQDILIQNINPNQYVQKKEKVRKRKNRIE